MNMTMTQREVTLKLSAKADPSLTKPLVDLAESAKAAGVDEAKYQRSFQERIGAYRMAAQLKKDLAKVGIGAEMSEEQKYQQLLRQRIKDYETAKRLKADLGKVGIGGEKGGIERFGDQLAGASPLGRALTPATAALTALTLALKGAKTATEQYYQSLEYNPATGRAEVNPVSARQGFQHFLAEKPITSFFGLFSESTRRQERDTSPEAYERYRQSFQNRGGVSRFLDRWLGRESFGQGRLAQLLTGQKPTFEPEMMTEKQFRQAGLSERQQALLDFEAEQKRRYAPMQSAAELRQIQQHNALLADYGRTVAESRAAARMLGAQSRISQQAGSARMGAINEALTNPQYARESQIEDYNRQIAMREQLAQTGAQGQARRQSIQHQLGIAQRQEGGLQQRFQTAQKEEQTARAKVEAARREGEGAKEVVRLQQAAAAATDQRKQSEEALIAAQQRSYELRKQGEESIRQTIEQEAAILRGSLEALQREQQSLKRQQAQSTERLGLLHPMQQRTVVGIANKIKMGQNLNFREMQFAEGHRDIFGNYLERVGRERGKGMMDHLRTIPQLGLQNREKELEKQEVKLKQEIHVKLDLAGKALTEELAKTLMPEVKKTMGQLALQLQNEMDRLRHQMDAERRRMFRESN